MHENIIRFEQMSKQTVGGITKIVGLVRAKHVVPIIDNLDLEANPRSSRLGGVTDSIQDSIETDSSLFPFKTKGILLASSDYKELDRGRIIIRPVNKQVEGILDGGHNTLAVGHYILSSALAHVGITIPKSIKTWDAFKTAWIDNHAHIENYLAYLREEHDGTESPLNFLVPVELLVPKDPSDEICAENFRNNLLEICAARNNNVQLNDASKANQSGFFDDLREIMREKNPALEERIEWKPNEGLCAVKVQDIIALSWLPLSLVKPAKDSNGRTIEPPAPNKIYSGKQSCLKQFEKLMKSDEVTIETSNDYRRELRNYEVRSALRISADLPELYDYIYEHLADAYNAAGGTYGRINAVKKLNASRKNKVAPFTGKTIETMSPDGFVAPLVYGLKELMESRTNSEGKREIVWKTDPYEFLEKNFNHIVSQYREIFAPCDYDPQKIGKAPLSYTTAEREFKIAFAGI